jgi:hypothetical protein
MKWFDNWINRKVKDVYFEQKIIEESKNMANVTISSSGSGYNGTSGLNLGSMVVNQMKEPTDRPRTSSIEFRLYPATGGWIVETSEPFNPESIKIVGGRQAAKLHIITDEQDIGQRLGQILTLEALQR